MGGKIATEGRSELTHEPCDDIRLPESIVVKKYRTRVLADVENFTRHSAHFLLIRQSSESGSRVPGGDDSTIGAKKRVLDNIRHRTSMGKKTEHFGKSVSTGRPAGSNIRLTRIKPAYSGDDKIQ